MGAQSAEPKVVAGLRLLPWVSWQRRKNADDRPHDRYGKKYLDCGVCREMTTREERLAMGCGWEPKGSRTGVLSLPPGFPDADECPGYLIQLPDVQEAARAVSWKRDGMLRDYLDGQTLTQNAKDYIDVVSSEIKEVEAHSIRVAREGAKRG